MNYRIKLMIFFKVGIFFSLNYFVSKIYFFKINLQAFAKSERSEIENFDKGRIAKLKNFENEALLSCIITSRFSLIKDNNNN